MTSEWAIFLLVFGAVAVVMARLDRLGNQLEAVSVQIRSELVSDDNRRQEILSEWKDVRKETAKDARRFWLFWLIVGVVALGVLVARNYSN